MDADENIVIGCARVSIEDRTFINAIRDVEALIRIIDFTNHRRTLVGIVNNIGGPYQSDMIEIAGDVDTLNSITIRMEDDNSLLNNGRTFSQDDLDTALISACRLGYTFLVLEILKLGADVQAKDSKGNTPLLICAENCFSDIARYFISRDNINAANDVGDTALILAARQTGSVEIVKLLLAQTGISVNYQNKEGYTALMKAVEALNADVIRLLLDSQKDATEMLSGIKNCRSETAQDIADKLGLGNIFKLFKEGGTNVCNPMLSAVLEGDMDSFNTLMKCQFYNPSNKKLIQDSFRALFTIHEQSKENFSENEEKIIQRLLEDGLGVGDCPYSPNPLLVATRVGSYNVVRMLLRCGAGLPMVSIQRHSLYKYLLVTSAKHGHTHIIELLLNHDRKMEEQYFTTPALISAMKNGHLNCIQQLTKHGASLDIKFAFESAVNDNNSVHLKYLIENFRVGINRVVSAKCMNNLLLSAVSNRHTDIIGMLLDFGANINGVDGAKKTPLTEAKNTEMQRGPDVDKCRTDSDYISHVTFVLSKYLSEGGKVKTFETLSPLMTAVFKRVDKNIVEMLLERGADASVRDSNGSTVLLIAAESNSTENIECLLQQAKVRDMINVQNQEGLTALMISARKNNQSALKLLIDHGADVNLKDEVGNTALLLAMRSDIENPEILTTLIQAGSDINWQNKSGNSALILAAHSSFTNVLRLLVDSGADVNTVGANNDTALSLIMRKVDPKPSCVEYLLDHGALASYVKPEDILELIQRRNLQFIPRLMQCGLVPTEVSPIIMLCTFYIDPAICTFTPLCMALATGHIKLASYFVENLFVTKSDMFALVRNVDMRQHLRKNSLHECLAFLDKLSVQPLSLFSQAFLAVQSAVGTTPRRDVRVSTLPLPQIIKDRLMFKTESKPLDMIDKTAGDFAMKSGHSHLFENYHNYYDDMNESNSESDFYYNSCDNVSDDFDYDDYAHF